MYTFFLSHCLVYLLDFRVGGGGEVITKSFLSFLPSLSSFRPFIFFLTFFPGYFSSFYSSVSLVIALWILSTPVLPPLETADFLFPRLHVEYCLSWTPAALLPQWVARYSQLLLELFSAFTNELLFFSWALCSYKNLLLDLCFVDFDFFMVKGNEKFRGG